MELKNENFSEEIKVGQVLVDFYATWCGPCKMMHPIMEQVSNEHPELKVIKVDVDQHEELSRQYGVMSIPTLFLFEDGQIKKQNIGFTPLEVIESWLN